MTDIPKVSEEFKAGWRAEAAGDGTGLNPYWDDPRDPRCIDWLKGWRTRVIWWDHKSTLAYFDQEYGVHND